MCPYKSAVKNLQELLYLFNLQALYAISLYSRDATNMTAVNILIIMAALQFCIICMYHMITYMCNERSGRRYKGVSARSQSISVDYHMIKSMN